MATAKLTKFWTVYFEDGHRMEQPEDDRYSKHDDSSEWNPSSFRDILEYPSKPIAFTLGDVSVDLAQGRFAMGPFPWFSMEIDELHDRKLIYYRETERDMIDGEWQEARIMRYAVGYEGKNSEGKVEKKVIFIDGE